MEIVSKKSLLEIEQEKLLDPMGMVDTNFFVTEPERLKRLAQPLPNDQSAALNLVPAPATEPPPLPQPTTVGDPSIPVPPADIPNASN